MMIRGLGRTFATGSGAGALREAPAQDTEENGHQSAEDEERPAGNNRSTHCLPFGRPVHADTHVPGEKAQPTVDALVIPDLPMTLTTPSARRRMIIFPNRVVFRPGILLDAFVYPRLLPKRAQPRGSVGACPPQRRTDGPPLLAVATSNGRSSAASVSESAGAPR